MNNNLNTTVEKVLRPLGNNQDISEIAHYFSTKSQILEMYKKKTSTLSQGATSLFSN